MASGVWGAPPPKEEWLILLPNGTPQLQLQTSLFTYIPAMRIQIHDHSISYQLFSLSSCFHKDNIERHVAGAYFASLLLILS